MLTILNGDGIRRTPRARGAGHGKRYVVAAALAALTVAAGCGDSNDANIILGHDSTPTAGGPTPAPDRTATSARTGTPTPDATPTPAGGASPTPTATPSGAVNVDAQTVVSDIVPFLTLGAPLAVGVSSSALTATSTRSTEANKVDDCPEGGTRTETDQGLARTITLDACGVSDLQLGSFEFDGTMTIDFAAGTVIFDFVATDVANEHDVEFTGTLTGTVQSTGGFVLSGLVTVSTPQGDFSLTLDDLTVASNRDLVSGSGTATDDDDEFDIASIALTINQGGETANVLATFDDDSTASYVLDLRTGQLSPAS